MSQSIHPLFVGVSISNSCLLPCSFEPSDPELFEVLEPLGFTRAEQPPLGDDVDRERMMASAFQTARVRTLARFRFRPGPRDLRLENCPASVGSPTFEIRPANITISLTAFQGGLASLSSTLTLDTSRMRQELIGLSSGISRNGKELLPLSGPNDRYPASRFGSGLDTADIVSLTRKLCRSDCPGTENGCDCSGMLPDLFASVRTAINVEADADHEDPTAHVVFEKTGPCRHEGSLTYLWDTRAREDAASPRRLSAEETRNGLAADLDGILARDIFWTEAEREKKSDGVTSDGIRVDHAGGFLSGDRLLIVSEPSQIDWDKMRIWGTETRALRALEWAIYQRALVEAAGERVRELEAMTTAQMRVIRTDLGSVETGTDDSGDVTQALRTFLENVMIARAGILADIESNYRPEVFRFGFEKSIVAAFFEADSTSSRHKLAMDRLASINTLAAEAHDVASAQKLSVQQARLANLQETSLESQQQLRELTEKSQQSSDRLSWINGLVAISAGLQLLSLYALRDATGNDPRRLAARMADFFGGGSGVNALILLGSTALAVLLMALLAPLVTALISGIVGLGNRAQGRSIVRDSESWPEPRSRRE